MGMTYDRRTIARAFCGTLSLGAVVAACTTSTGGSPSPTGYPYPGDTGAGAGGETGVGAGVGGGTLGVGGESAPVDTTPVVLAATPPPPLSGGTMLRTQDGATLVAADPDRDMIWWTQWNAAAPTVQSLALNPGDEPGRLVEDAAGLVHVALRSGGAIATIDLAGGVVVRRTPVCAAPRGVAYDSTQDAVIVACVGGELVTLAAADDTVLRSLVLDTDLRDPVVLASGYLAVSKLRNAEILLVDPTGAIASRTIPAVTPNFVADSAWRMVGVEGGTSVTVAHQLGTMAAIDTTQPGGYTTGGQGSLGTGGGGEGGGVGGGGSRTRRRSSSRRPSSGPW